MIIKEIKFSSLFEKRYKKLPEKIKAKTKEREKFSELILFIPS